MVIFTTIKITKEVRDDLAKLGAKDDTFNTIIRRLIAFHKLTPKKEVRDGYAKINKKWEGKV